MLLASGIYKIVQVWDSIEMLMNSPFGIALSLKLGLVAVLLLLSYLHDFVWGPQLIKLNEQLSSEEYRKSVARLSFWARVNVLIGIAIVLLGAFLRINPFSL